MPPAANRLASPCVTSRYCTLIADSHNAAPSEVAMSRMGYQAVRDLRWKYIHYVDLDGMDELYDMKADPYEMNNLAAHSQTGETVAQLRGKLQELVDSSK